MAGSPRLYIAFSIISSHVFLVVHRRLYQPACLLNCSRLTVLQQLCGLQSGVERSWGVIAGAVRGRKNMPIAGSFF